MNPGAPGADWQRSYLGSADALPETPPADREPLTCTANKSESPRDACTALKDGIASGKVRVLVDRVFALDDVATALDYMPTNAHVGKNALRP